MNATLMTLKAIEFAADLPGGTVFNTKDLFPGEWEGFERGDKLELGRRFKNAVLNNQVNHVVYLGGSPAVYKKEGK